MSIIMSKNTVNARTVYVDVPGELIRQMDRNKENKANHYFQFGSWQECCCFGFQQESERAAQKKDATQNDHRFNQCRVHAGFGSVDDPATEKSPGYGKKTDQHPGKGHRYIEQGENPKTTDFTTLSARPVAAFMAITSPPNSPAPK